MTKWTPHFSFRIALLLTACVANLAALPASAQPPPGAPSGAPPTQPSAPPKPAAPVKPAAPQTPPAKTDTPADPSARPAIAAPTPQELIAKFITATGGIDRWRKDTSRKIVSRGTLSGLAGTEFEIIEFMRAPNKFLTITTMTGIGEIRQGFDGTVGWSMDPMQGPILAGDAETAQQKRLYDFNRLLNLADLYPKLETIGPATFESFDCWELKAAAEDGDTVTLYFDKEFGLLRGEKLVIRTRGGDTPALNAIKTYKEFDGLKLPVESNQTITNMVVVIKIISVEFNVVDEKEFELPMAIKTLVDAQKPGGGKPKLDAPDGKSKDDGKKPGDGKGANDGSTR